MTKRMLVDAAYPEETRVVVADNETLLDFDFETVGKRQLKGNIYLAKVVRVEPSLQAAFVDYGGNRHGFLAFSEIHPDYYQVPQADRDRLQDLEAQMARAAGDDDADADTADADPDAPPPADTVNGDVDAEPAELASQLRRERSKLLRSYKIQEVVKRRQIMLVQVVKEERGTKGAALTTYLSLAGRYCVLMPNTPKGGGISRKIATAADRTRLKTIVGALAVPDGMGLIIRTAGQERTRAEIRRDYEYLLRLWNDIRERTLESIAPCPIYEEADLIRRAMRDLYTNDIEEVLVEGEEGYRAAKAFMTMLMPSRARRVKQYKDDVPVFFAHKVEDHLDKMHDSTVQLRSGGSIVIHTTEALTAIDVNSGRATRERHIDETAVKTNLEAADEIARQLRLRDIAGLVVIDFIDMAENRHQRQVEKRLRDALKIDRARLQVGRISVFGLLELSRQRLRPSFLELSTQPCPACHGTGFIRSTESAALQALRRVEALGVDGKASKVAVTLPVEVALYLLNRKREDVQRVEQRYGLHVLVGVDERLVASELKVEVLETDRAPAPAPSVASPEPAAVADGDENRDETVDAAADDAGAKRKRRRRRRPRRKGETDGAEMAASAAEGDADLETEDTDEAATVIGPAPSDAMPDDIAAAEAAAFGPPLQEAASEPKPPRRRRRRRPASEPEAAPAGETAPSAAEPAATATPSPAEDAVEEGGEALETYLIVPEPPDLPADTHPYGDIDDTPFVVDPMPAGERRAGMEEAATMRAADTVSSAAAEPAVIEPVALEAATAEINGRDETAAVVPERTPIEDRPDVVVNDAAVAEAPRRQGWWSRWTRSGGD